MNHVILLLSIIILLLLIIATQSRKQSTSRILRRIYFAGSLFNLQELIGNEVLATAIEKQSRGRYEILLPQHQEQSEEKSAEIRNNDLLQVIKSDGLILNATGADVDSGAVVEFMVSKFMAKPSILLQADIRGNLNLMLSNYPRTKELHIHSLDLYKSLGDDVIATTKVIADKIIVSLDEVFNTPTLEAISYEQAIRLLGITTND